MVYERSSWNPSELDVERLIVPSNVGETFSINIFNEELLYLGRQLRTSHGKRLDVLCVDKAGRAVVVELKKDTACLGVDTQALQYLASYFDYRGEKFLDIVCGGDSSLRSSIIDFCDAEITDINSEARIILLAQDFDPALFSMGRWLGDKKVAIKFVEYRPFCVDNSDSKFVAFSVRANYSHFDEYAGSLFRPIESVRRKPATFWHNIGIADESWWSFIVKEGIVTTSYSNLNSPSCIGYQKIKQYIDGDKIVAYASGYGAVGCGQVIGDSYEYKKHDFSKYRDEHYHRIKVKWEWVLSLDKGISSRELREDFLLNHPSSTIQAQRANPLGTSRLIEALAEKSQSIKKAG